MIVLELLQYHFFVADFNLLPGKSNDFMFTLFYASFHINIKLK